MGATGSSRFNLKTKMTLAVGGLAVCLLVLQALFQVLLVQGDQRQLVANQLNTLVEQAARELDDKIVSRQSALKSEASGFPLALLNDLPRLENYLRNEQALLTLVDDLYVFSPQGLLLVDWPVVPGRRRLDMSEREYIRQTIARKTSVISEPILGRITKQPLVIITAPLLDEQGRLRGILAGVLNLYKANILGDLREIKVGQSGYFVLTHPNRNVIMHPDPARILKPDSNGYGRDFYSPAQASVDSTQERLVDQQLILLAHRQLRSTGWLMSAVYPAAEAFYPIERMSKRTLLITIVLTLLSTPLIWLVAQRFLRPLEHLTEQIRSLFANGRVLKEGRVTPQGSEEIQELAKTFNEFMERNERAEHELLVHERRLSLVLETASDGIWDWDVGSGEITGNQSLANIFGMTADGIFRTDLQRLDSHLLDDEREYIANGLRACLNGSAEVYYAEHRLVQHAGRTIWVLNRGRVVERDAAGRAVRMIGSFTDISRQKESEARIRQMAFFDSLTGLPNRARLAETVAAAMINARDADERLALLFVDLDQFKNINDSLGHFTGDLLLQAVGLRLAARIGDAGLLARQGGDEFVIVLYDADAKLAEKMAQQLLADAARPYAIEARQLNITASIGISFYPDDADNFETLLRHADIAMYRAKERGRNTYCLFTSAMNEVACKRLELESAMREGLERQEFSMHYQPQVDLHSGHLIGMEALARWQHPRLGNIPPMTFIPIAEDSGLIAPLGDWVLREACRQARAWQDAGLPPFLIAVNISAVQFRQPQLPEVVAEVLASSGLAPEWLELEITEGMVMEDIISATTMLERLKSMGVRLAIDDFGTGYSSLGYLKSFPIDKLKIDRSFVTDLVWNSQDQAIARAIIGLAHSLDLVAIAEGVETVAQLDVLKQQGCDEFQGYLSSRPLPAADIEAWMRGRKIRPGQASGVAIPG